MRTGQFSYSILRYIHSQLLGEVVNVGILLVFPDHNRILFKYPKKLTRIKELYEGFDDHHIKEYLKAFYHKAEKLNKQLAVNTFTLFSDPILLRNVISEEFIREDSSALQFSEPRFASLYKADLEEIADEHYKLFLSNYPDDSKLPGIKHDEQYVLRKYKTFLKLKKLDINRYLNEEGKVVNADKTSLKFDLSWQNEKTHLIKPISFDLADTDQINSKSMLFFGRLSFLDKIAEEENFMYDLLITKPQNQDLFGAYNNALDILRACKAPVDVITESKLENYSEQTAAQVHSKE